LQLQQPWSVKFAMQDYQIQQFWFGNILKN